MDGGGMPRAGRACASLLVIMSAAACSSQGPDNPCGDLAAPSPGIAVVADPHGVPAGEHLRYCFAGHCGRVPARFVGRAIHDAASRPLIVQFYDRAGRVVHSERANVRLHLVPASCTNPHATWSGGTYTILKNGDLFGP